MGMRIDQFHGEGEIKIWNSGRQEKHKNQFANVWDA
jgi:hypothetical protein